MPIEEKISFCRLCPGGCGMILQVEDGQRILSMRGDPESPLTGGYACFKGMQGSSSHQGGKRLLRPLVRRAGGRLEEIDSMQAFDEIAERLQAIIHEHGPDSVAVFSGNGVVFNLVSYVMLPAFLTAIGSSQYFSTLTIDQSAKYISTGRLGSWAAGFPAFEDMDIVLLFGANPLVAHASLDFLQSSPVRSLKRARANGLKLVVVDPRNTETARNADVHLQPIPGEDTAIACGILHVILAEDWEDKAFCARWIGRDRIEALRRAIEPFTPTFVERRAGLEPGQIRLVAKMFARDGRVGAASGATGPCMAPFSNLSQHMIETINVVCGRFLREGERVHKASPILPQTPVYAEVNAPTRPWESSGNSRIRGTRLLYGERCSGTLSDEILTPGKGRIRALFVDGGDPMTSLPDTWRTDRALRDLELLVSIDPWVTATGHHAHYIIPPLMQYERPDLPMMVMNSANWPRTWTQYTPATVPPPSGSDLINDWYLFWALAKRLGKTIHLNGTDPLDMDVAPTTDHLLEKMMAGAPISLNTLKEHPHGLFADLGEQWVQPAREGAVGRFDPMPDDILAELEKYLGTAHQARALKADGKPFSHMLITHRMRDFFNSTGRNIESVRARNPYNPAFLHPQDMAMMGLSKGDVVKLVSAHGSVTAIVAEDTHLRPGVLSISHGWGGLPGDESNILETGSAVNRLIDTDRNYEPINAMPHMSAVPIDIIPMKYDRADLQARAHE